MMDDFKVGDAVSVSVDFRQPLWEGTVTEIKENGEVVIWLEPPRSTKDGRSQG